MCRCRHFNPAFVVLSLLLLLLYCPVFGLDQSQQHPIRFEPTVLFPSYRNFSVGFSLHSSYAAAAVIFSYPDGRLDTHTTVIHGGAEYRKVMAKLSLDSSRHLAPPYRDDGEYWADRPRWLARNTAKSVGLPASYEVGILSSLLASARRELEAAHGISIREAVFSAPHLAALYKDDIEDVAFHLGINYVTPQWQFREFLWENAATYAGMGLGLCKTWWDIEECNREEEEFLADTAVMAVHYGRNALQVSHCKMRTATDIFEPEWRHVENYTLGRQVANGEYQGGGGGGEEGYWLDVKDFLLVILREWGFMKPDVIMLSGDAVDQEFIKRLYEAMRGHLGEMPPCLVNDSLAVAARGCAELMRRGRAPWSD